MTTAEQIAREQARRIANGHFQGGEFITYTDEYEIVRSLDFGDIKAIATALAATERERDHYAEQLGLVYWHVSGGELSKPYDFKDVESRIDDHLNEFYGKDAQEAEQQLAAALTALASIKAALLAQPLMTSEAKALRTRVGEASMGVWTAVTPPSPRERQLEQERDAYRQKWHDEAERLRLAAEELAQMRRDVKPDAATVQP